MNISKYADIAVNLVDPMYNGIYNRSNVAYHIGDLDHVISRAYKGGVKFMLGVSGNLQESKETIELCKKYHKNGINDSIFATVGCHPTRTLEFENTRSLNINGIDTADAYFNELKSIITEDMSSDHPKIIAIGEIGLDYCRTNFAPVDIQKKYFIKQLEMALYFDLPLYLHDRDTNGDFYNIMIDVIKYLPRRGVLHSFTGSLGYMKKIVEDLDLYIGINGCSLKTEEGLNVAKNIPLNRLLLETDSPWCSIKSKHASFPLLNDYEPHPEADGLKEHKPKNFKEGELVNSRNEPCHVRKIYHVIAKLRNISLECLMDAVNNNINKLFSL